MFFSFPLLMAVLLEAVHLMTVGKETLQYPVLCEL
jgi:hypothetical protein